MQKNEFTLDKDGVIISVDNGSNKTANMVYTKDGAITALSDNEFKIESKKKISIKVAESSMEIEDSVIEISVGKAKVNISKSGAIKISVGDGGASFELSASSAALTAPNVSIEAKGQLSLKGQAISIN